jgi:hypothetical protein
MITIDCPICDGAATTDETLATLSCEGCGVSVDVAADPVLALDAAA